MKREEEIYSISQTQYINKVIKAARLEDTKTSNIPLDRGYIKMIGDQTPMQNSERYQMLIWALLYITVNTRPDIVASVTILSQRNKEPTEVDWTEANRVIRYLKGTKDKWLKLCHR